MRQQRHDIDPGLKPHNACLQVHGGEGLGCHAKSSAGVTKEVNLKESVIHTPLPSANKAATLALKPRGDVTRSPKQGYQWPDKKELSFLKKTG